MNLLYDVMPYATMFTGPLVLAALGGLVCERSGVVNIALEGLMVFGGFICAIFIHTFYDSLGYPAVWLGILTAGIATAIFSLLHAYASIDLGANQVISGTAINLIAPAITIFLSRLWTGTQNIAIVQGVKRNNIPVLSEIPVIGPMFFKGFYITTLFIIFITIVVWYWIFQTKGGLRLRACGENPHAADSLGISVRKMRYIGVVTSGLLTGLSGAVFITVVSLEFSGTVAGLGFLSLGALIFGKWKPFSVLGATFFFGFAKTLGEVARVNDTLKALSLPPELYNALPYILTIVALVLFSSNNVGPKAVGEPYDVEQR
ncbi:MAG: ABC transporter permease [Lachnospirales bacterium]